MEKKDTDICAICGFLFEDHRLVGEFCPSKMVRLTPDGGMKVRWRTTRFVHAKPKSEHDGEEFGT